MPSSSRLRFRPSSLEVLTVEGGNVRFTLVCLQFFQLAHGGDQVYRKIQRLLFVLTVLRLIKFSVMKLLLSALSALIVKP
jgi:hypothetical protein